MGRMLDAFPTETLILHKKDGTTAEVTALVDDDMIHCDDASVIIEEDDIYERTLPNGAKEYYRIIDRGFYKGAHGIPDNYQSKVQKISKSIAEKMMVEVKEKPHKLFISHSSKDKPYMEALSEMLEDIGMPDGSFVCTSVAGHGIPGGAKIYDWLRDQFLKCDLRVLFVLSRNYYESAASLNEMGAAWVTKVSDTLLLLPGFDFSDIKGCVDPREMGISFGMDENGNDLPKTVISREYSSEWKPGDEPYYPVNDKKNGDLYQEYKKLGDAEEKVIFGGRLGEYKYYDMDQVIAAALKKANEC